MAKLGTPENPEVIEPGRRPRGPVSPLGARLRTALKLVKSMVVVCGPAVLLDYAWMSLMHHGWRDQNAFSILLGLVLTPPALIATGVAALAGPLLMMSLVFLLIGRPVVFDSGRHRPFSRFRVQRR